MARLAKWLAALAGSALLLAAIPCIYVETQCFDSRPREAISYTPILPQGDRRALVDTFLTYPEWSIVHAYEDLAAVSRAKGEAAFDYAGAVTRYWGSLCSLAGAASAKGDVAADMKAMLYIIGVSFSGELAVKGMYEKTIGRLTQWTGGAGTPEDRFAHDLADDYADFLRQTPWYEYPFGPKLAQFWRETPFDSGAPLRSLERRVALSLEWGAKTIYAKLMGVLAGASPAKLTMRSVISNVEQADAAADGAIRVIAQRADGSSIIETPRYQAFTEFLLKQIANGRSFIEIAGNDHILVTALTPEGAPTPPMAELLLTVPVQARPGWVRRGLYVSLAELPALIQATREAGGTFEHAYDY